MKLSLASCAALLLAAGLARADDVYTWVDAAGVAHYTNDLDTIPPDQRGRAKATSGAPIGETGKTAAAEPEKPKPVSEGEPSAESTLKETARGPAARGGTFEETAPPPAEIPAGGLDEQGWRTRFRQASNRVKLAELSLARDHDALDRVPGEDQFYTVDYRGQVITGSRSTALRLQVREDERVLEEARENLHDLERAAAREAIPFEWRR